MENRTMGQKVEIVKQVKLSPNQPLQLALQDPSGVPDDFRVHYQTSDGRVLTLPRRTAIELNLLDLRQGEAFCICRDVQETKGVPKSSYRVWLPAVTEQERAAAEAEAEPALILTVPAPEAETPRRLSGLKRKRAKSDDQPRLFDRGTGTYGPMPQNLPAEIRASGPIPMNLAFREVTAFVTAELKAAGEQWTDQAKQDVISTVLISAAKKGWLKVWER